MAQDRAPSRRSDVIRCENCGEDYSTTYRCCPFCDERPGRTGVNGRRVDGGSSVPPIQMVGLVISLVLIITALFIVFKYVSPLIFGWNTGDVSSNISTSQSDSSSSTSQSSSQSSGDQSEEASIQPLTLELNKVDITLQCGEDVQLTASVLPLDTTEPVIWSSSHPNVAYVDETGLVRNVNTGTKKVKVTITATCGNLTAECTIYCRAEAAESKAEGSTGTIKNAKNGLNVRSGPGSGYEKVGTLHNGDTVTILKDADNGWYQVKLSNGYIGYVSSSYVSVR